jgi:hypothetical protein
MGTLPRHPPRHATGWHPGFAQLISERGPGDIEVQAEVQLSRLPRRADLLLLRRTGKTRAPRPAQVLRGLWPLIGKVALVEFKSPGHEFREGDLVKLCSYGLEYLHIHRSDLADVLDLTLVLVTPRLNGAVHRDLAFTHGALRPLDPERTGYASIVGGVHYVRTVLVTTDEVSRAENDAFLSIFSHTDIPDPAADHWFRGWVAQQVKTMGDPAKIQDFDPIIQKLLARLTPEERLKGLAPEERVAGLAPEERVAGLAPEERVAGLAPEERLAGLDAEEVVRVVESLPPDLRRAIRDKLGA